jgi:CRISPR-associated endonuclease Csy4
MAMDSYLDIELRPDPETASNHLLGALYAKVHQALVAQHGSNVAVCFPDHQMRPSTLGTRLRLLGSQAALQAVTATDWLGSMRDHVRVSAMAAVPPDAQHRSVRRVQAKSNPERLRRRLMKRHDLTPAQALDRIPDSAAELLNLPFVQLRSTSSGQPFRMFLSVGPALPAATTGEFNAYGLSQTATVPWF